ncbi:pleckstrin homology domain-containing family M member 3 [Denticeps clupeoides]|uniref:PH domain-containing protein n=1 Tax=Denticeps clupeoides TaxID=299321 RepID=A0AAY4EWT8_9TELE|nr:pleckstrin homology domain-containing family M member 3 [Denticeps clupeoides]XP_028820356.1 pleckstrin homology domain-containing family M member 3 [Denticeps clupeoides]
MSEGLAVEDISPALEVTEDLHCLDGSPEDDPVHSPKLQEVSALSKLSSSGVWGLLAGEQLEVSPRNVAWTDQPASVSVLGLRHGKRSRARSTNDLAVHAKDTNTCSKGAFKRGHNRSRSDVNYCSYNDNGVPVVDKNTLKNMAINNQTEAHKESSGSVVKQGDQEQRDGPWGPWLACGSVVKQGELEQRDGPWGPWLACHVELTACELRLYSLDGSGNRQLCTALSLSHCQAVSAPQAQDGRVLQALFFSSTQLQLRAPCQREASEWRRLLWDRVLAARPVEAGGARSPSTDSQASDSASTPARPRPPERPTALPLFTQHCVDVIKAGLLHQLGDLNNWKAFTFVLSRTQLQAFPTEGRGPVSEPVLCHALASCLAVQRDEAPGGSSTCFQVVFPNEVWRLRAESEAKAQDWVEGLRTAVANQRGSGGGGQLSQFQPQAVVMRTKPARERRHRDGQRSKRQSVTTSFLSILTCLAVEKGLTAQSFRCAGCQRPVGLSWGKAKVCYYSGWYYCQSCHQDSLFLIPARLLHNWDTSKHKVSKQAKEFLEFVYEEPLLDVHQLNPCLYTHSEPLATVLKLRQQLQSLRAYLFSCRASVAEDLRRRIFPREYLLQHVHLYSLADLQQVIDGKLAPFLSKVIKFASGHVYSCSLCKEKGFICELCHNGQVIYPFQESVSKRCDICGAVFHAECRLRAQPCPRCVRRELHKRPTSFWKKTDPGSPDDDLGCFELDT